MTQSGIYMLPMTAGMFVLGVLAGPLAARFGSKRVLITGSLITIAPFAMLVAGHDQAWQIYTASALIGLGLAFSAMSAIVVEAVPPAQTGAASGMNANIRTIGGAIGSAMAASILSTGVTAAHPFPQDSGYTDTFWFLTGSAVLAAAAAFAIPAVKRGRSDQSVGSPWPAGDRAQGPDPRMTTPHRPATNQPRTMRRDAAQNRERLLRAAWEVFAELGPDAGVEVIAARAGVGMGTLYRRFPTKEDLLAALSDEILDSILAVVRRAAAEPPAARGLERALWDTGTVLAAHHGWLTRLWAAIPPEADERRAELLSLLDGLLIRAQDAGEVREEITLSDVYASLLALRVLIDDTEGRTPDVWRRHLAIVLAGFRPATEPLAHPATDDTLIRANTPKRLAE